MAVVPHTKYMCLLACRMIYAYIILIYRANNNSNPSLLRSLSNEKRVLFAPFNNEYGTCNDTYDDKCILHLAVRYDGAVVSNDNYRDLINSNTGKVIYFSIRCGFFNDYFCSDWRKIIESRVISFCFFKDMFMVPQDPYGPDMPSLSDILTKAPV